MKKKRKRKKERKKGKVYVIACERGEWVNVFNSPFYFS